MLLIKDSTPDDFYWFYDLNGNGFTFNNDLNSKVEHKKIQQKGIYNGLTLNSFLVIH